jgi:hypothetical protein
VQVSDKHIFASWLRRGSVGHIRVLVDTPRYRSSLRRHNDVADTLLTDYFGVGVSAPAA